MLPENIKIKAVPHMSNPYQCDFVIETPQTNLVGYHYFASLKEANGSPLAEELFKIEGIKSVLVVTPNITITKSGDIPWPQIGKQIGTAIRLGLIAQNPINPLLFTVKNSDQVILEQINKVIVEFINPAVASHGGIIVAEAVKNYHLYLRMGGGCQGCASSTATLKQGVETTLRQHVQNLGEIFDITNHQEGQNPYLSHVE